MNRTQTDQRASGRKALHPAWWILPAALVGGAGIWSRFGGADAASMASAALAAAVLALSLVLAVAADPRTK